MPKQRVALFGASGTMGFQAFKELWKRRGEYDISILVLPSEQSLGIFQQYEREAGIKPIQGAGVAEGDGLKIVWGDAANYADIAETIQGADWVLNAMAYISPMADYHPHLAKIVNVDAVSHILRAIEAEPDGLERVRYIHTGTVAETGSRPPGIHVGRVGDPLNPSVFDYYAITKIKGERLVLESDLRRWASLRLTFIMPTNYPEQTALNDAIAFHMPMDSRMENITDRDAGFGLVNCLDIPDDSDFWRRVYNMGGGPNMRTIAYDYIKENYASSGLRLEHCAKRHWYAVRNFHMQYYEDSEVLNTYLHYWRDSLADHNRLIANDTPFGMKLVSFLAKRIPAFRAQVEKAAFAEMKKMAENHRNSPRYWVTHKNDARVSAFFNSYADYEAIPDWGVDMPDISPDTKWERLQHGYPEEKDALVLGDLQQAAKFRGGTCTSANWDGDLYAPLNWECAFGHTFTARPFTVLKAGHWCPQCDTSWNGDEKAKQNPFFAQVWYADHDRDEANSYADDCFNDILDADKDWIAFDRTA